MRFPLLAILLMSGLGAPAERARQGLPPPLPPPRPPVCPKGEHGIQSGKYCTVCKARLRKARKERQ